jgi:hypothetical protein
MRPVTVVGIILIVLGVVALAYQGITYTTSEKVVDLGPLQVEAKRERTIPLPPLLGGLALAGGIRCLPFRAGWRGRSPRSEPRQCPSVVWTFGLRGRSRARQATIF